MKSAIGPMNWRLPDFWAATMTEFFDAVDVFNEMHRDPKDVEAPSEDEMAKLLERYG